MVASEASKALEEDLYQMLLDAEVYTAIDSVLKCQENVGDDGDLVFNTFKKAAKRATLHQKYQRDPNSRFKTVKSKLNSRESVTSMDLTLLENQNELNGGGSTGTPDFNSPKTREEDVIDGSSIDAMEQSGMFI